MAITIKCDFHADWIAYIRRELAGFGYDASGDSEEEVLHCFFNLRKRLIRPTVRKVLKSQEFRCPPELLAGLQLVEAKIESRENLKPHLSRLLKKSDYNDGMLNDWGIYHLHLGTKLESDGFVSRTEPVLFARFDSANAYFIDMQPHGAWALQENVRILHRNWPDSIKRFQLVGVLALSDTRSNQEIKVLRSKQTNSAIEVDGTFYVALGGGITTSGLAVEAVIQSDRWTARVKQLEAQCRNSPAAFEEAAAGHGHSLPDALELHLEISDDGHAVAVVHTLNLGFDLGPFSL